MATAGSLISDVQRQFGDTNGTFITNAIGLEWLDIAQQRFCDNVLTLDEIKDYAVVEKQPRFDLPTNYVIARAVTWFQNQTRKLDCAHYSEYEQAVAQWPNSSGNPRFYTILRQQVVVGPASPLSNSATTLASGNQASTVTTLNLVAASGTFRAKGWVKISNEIIEYTGVATTTLTGCVRGVHGTDPASIASNATVTQMDMQLHYTKIPAALSATTSTPEIPAVWHRYLVNYVLYRAWLARGDSAKAEIAFNEFMEMEKGAKEKAGRRAIAPMGIKDWHRSRDRRGTY